MTLETELMNLIEEVRADMKSQKLEKLSYIESRSQLIARHFGWDGGGCTYAKVLAHEFGVEGTGKGPQARISEACKPFSEYLQGQELPAPTLECALSIVHELVPGTAQQVEAHLVEFGVTREAFRLDGLVKAAVMLHRHPNFVLQDVGKVRFVVPLEHASLLKHIRDVAATLVQHAGWAGLDHVAQLVQDQLGLPTSPAFVRSVLEAQSDFSWLQPEEGTFWLTNLTGNRLLKQIEKILAVARQIALSELEVAANRHNWKREATKEAKAFELPPFKCPPLPLLQVISAQIQGVRCVDGAVIVDESFPGAEDVLHGPERIMLDLLRDGFLRCHDFKHRFLAQHNKPRVFETYLSRSPILQRLPGGRVGLVGHV